MKRKPAEVKTATDAKKIITPNAWDRAIGFFFPGMAVRNLQARVTLARGYAGARTTPSQAARWLGGSDSNKDIRQDRQTVTNRVRQLVRDMPWLDGALDAAVAYKVGEGFNYKPAVVDDDGLMQQKDNKKIKEAFRQWCEKSEINGRDSFNEIQRLAARQMVESGEAIIVHRIHEKNYRLQVYESDSIQSLSTASNIDQGIEFNEQTNEFLYYHFMSNSVFSALAKDVQKIPAGEIIHMYRQLRPWQRRGMSPVVQACLMAADLEDYMDNELSAQQMASRWLAFISDPNGDDPGWERPKTRTIDNLTIEHVAPGQTVEFAPGADRPTAGMETFEKIFLRVLSVILHVPYHVISCDFNQLNYNQLREIRNNTLHLLKPDWAYLTKRLLRPVYCRWMDIAVLKGELNLKNYHTPEGKIHWQRCFFLPPGLESVDILRDIKGVIEAAKMGMIDPQDWIMKQGEDPEEIVAGIAQFNAMLKKAGIITEMNPDTKLDQSPSGLGTA